MFPECCFYDVSPYYRQMPMTPITGNYNTLTQGTTPAPMTPLDFEKAPGSPTDLGVEYTQGYLRTQIGKQVKIFFLIGTSIIQDREGTLTDVGISYVILREKDTNYKLLCDIYSIKFVTIYD